MDFKAPGELWNPLIKAVPGKFHGSGGHSKCNRFHDRANFHRSWAWQIALISKTKLSPGACVFIQPITDIDSGLHAVYQFLRSAVGGLVRTMCSRPRHVCSVVSFSCHAFRACVLWFSFWRHVIQACVLLHQHCFFCRSFLGPKSIFIKDMDN